MVADYGNGRNFFDTSTHLGRKPQYKGQSLAHFENVQPLELSDKTMKNIKDFVECHCLQKGCIASVKVAFLEKEGLIAQKFVKRTRI